MRAIAAVSTLAGLALATRVARAQTTGVPEEPAPSPPAPASPSATSPSLPLSGRLFAYLRAPVTDAPIEQASTSAWLEAHPKLGPSYARVTVTADAFATSVTGGAEVRGRVREGYVGIGNDRVDLRLGQQILPWGNADVVNPTDLLTVRDYTFFSADPEANRLGVLSARASWTPASWVGFELIGTPVAPASTLLVPPALVPTGVALHPLQPPAAKLVNAEGAARVAFTGDGWDVAFVGFHGWDHLPEFVPLGIEANGTIDVGLAQHRYLAGGGEASVAIASWVLRAESAYVSTENADGRNPMVQPTHWDSVVGVERAFFDEHLRVQAQGLVRDHPRYSPPTAAVGPTPLATQIEIALAQANSILESYDAQLRVGASLRIAYSTTDDTVGIEVFGLANVNDTHDFLVRPLIAYRPTDAVKLEAGAEIYGGPTLSPLGALHDYGGVFVQATYEF
jgi:hypothetical protein